MDRFIDTPTEEDRVKFQQLLDKYKNEPDVRVVINNGAFYLLRDWTINYNAQPVNGIRSVDGGENRNE